ncbi:unnamed protein product [Protopolystoma xenopodis]|uniref:Uncharacterized protein n=1 Tax=Protopolystoma xenopodis TaxID=117903 RepID=A0A3S5AM63_9PLAT|nr:unnamed protein product [Protopolystoma xenopodis]
MRCSALSCTSSSASSSGASTVSSNCSQASSLMTTATGHPQNTIRTENDDSLICPEDQASLNRLSNWLSSLGLDRLAHTK